MANIKCKTVLLKVGTGNVSSAKGENNGVVANIVLVCCQEGSVRKLFKFMK